jgi:hypothetical protein
MENDWRLVEEDSVKKNVIELNRKFLKECEERKMMLCCVGPPRSGFIQKQLVPVESHANTSDKSTNIWRDLEKQNIWIKKEA